MDKTRPTIAHGGSLMVCWLAEWSNVSFVYRALAYDATSNGHHLHLLSKYYRRRRPHHHHQFMKALVWWFH